MDELLIPFSLLVILLVPVLSFARHLRLLRQGKAPRYKAILLHVLYSAAPVLLYLAVFLVLVGLEELTDTALVSEGYARSLMIVCGLGTGLVIIGTVIFSITALLFRPGTVGRNR